MSFFPTAAASKTENSRIVTRRNNFFTLSSAEKKCFWRNNDKKLTSDIDWSQLWHSCQISFVRCFFQKLQLSFSQEFSSFVSARKMFLAGVDSQKQKKKDFEMHLANDFFEINRKNEHFLCSLPVECGQYSTKMVCLFYFYANWWGDHTLIIIPSVEPSRKQISFFVLNKVKAPMYLQKIPTARV